MFYEDVSLARASGSPKLRRDRHHCASVIADARCSGLAETKTISADPIRSGQPSRELRCRFPSAGRSLKDVGFARASSLVGCKVHLNSADEQGRTITIDGHIAEAIVRGTVQFGQFRRFMRRLP